MKVQNYKLIVETIQDGVFIICDDKIEYVNDAFLKMTGYSCNEVIGNIYINFVYEDDVDFVENTHKRRMAGEDVPTEYEFRLKHKDGSAVYVMMNVGIIDFNGKPAATGTFKNITDRINAELKIKDIESSYRTVLELCPDPIIISDFKGKILMHNQAAYNIHEPDSTEFKLLNRNIIDFMAPEQEKDTVVNLIPADTGTERYIVNFKTQKGRIIPFELNTTTIHDSNGTATCKVTIGRDVSQIKEYENTLKQLIYEKELVIKEIHHRIKNNLQQIYSLLGLQADSEFLQNSLKQSNCGCKDCYRMMQRIINDARRRILAISIIHQMFYKDTSDCIDFRTFIEKLSDNIKHTYDESDRDINVTVSGNSYELCLDYIIPCGLIINEILINSYKYAFKNVKSGKINIHLEYDGDLKTIILSDDGIGMTPKDSEDIATLGLTLIHGLTEQIGGTLEIKSEQDKGTIYKIIFSDKKTRA